MGWLTAKNELDIEQREFLKNLMNDEENRWIKGFPGSGKTILLLYSAKKIKEQKPESKILFIEFTHALIKMLEKSLAKMNMSDIRAITYYDFVDRLQYKAYDYILCDEVQDMPRQVLESMKEGAKRVIIAGDANQSIYDCDPRWHQPTCKPDDIESVFSPKEPTTLHIIHRLTRPIINAVNTYLPEMNILSGRRPMIKKNVQIRLWKAETQEKEVKHIMDEAIPAINVGSQVGILLKYHKQIVAFANFALRAAGKPEWEETQGKFGTDFRAMNEHLKENGIPMQYLANGYGSFLNNNLITLTTYHSSKGLDFDIVFLPFCNGSYRLEDFQSRTLFMVAMTRSRQDLYISYSMSPMNENVAKFKDQCLYKDWANDGVPSLFDDSPVTVNSGSSDSKDDDDIFG